MVSIPKIVGVMSCGVVLCLSLANVTQAADEAQVADRMKSDPCAGKTTGQPDPLNCERTIGEGAESIKGELLRISGDNYVVQRFTGQEVRLHTDAHTQIPEDLRQGNRIEAQVDEVRDMNDQRRVLSIHRIK